MIPTLETHFVIVGPLVDEEPTFWSNDPSAPWGDLEHATPFPSEILGAPLPPEGKGFLELTNDNQPVKFYNRQ